MSDRSPLARLSAAPVLACLDAPEPTADSDRPARGFEAAWMGQARRLLDHARAQGWPVAHVLSRRPPAGRGAWRTPRGFSPRPSEPVFHRTEPSAFSSLAFCEFVARFPDAELILIGVSLERSYLSTALAAFQLGMDAAAPLDAAHLPDVERSALAALSRLPPATTGRLRLESAARLIRNRPVLRLIEGGRK